ncbi:MAG: cysteine-rich CWC family protein [Gemmatimonadaceae bacterium]
MNNATIDPSLCPLCARPNECAMVDGGKTCWCFSTPMARDAIERIPSEQRGLACVCRNCGRTIEQTTSNDEAANK